MKGQYPRQSDRSEIATGSVVVKDVPNDVPAGGCPAKIIKSFKKGDDAREKRIV
jgi:serine acetyltransferase